MKIKVFAAAALMSCLFYPSIAPAPTAVEYALLGVVAEPEIGATGLKLQAILVTGAAEGTTIREIPFGKEGLAIIPHFEERLGDDMDDFTELFFIARSNDGIFIKTLKSHPDNPWTGEGLKAEWRQFLKIANNLNGTGAETEHRQEEID